MSENRQNMNINNDKARLTSIVIQLFEITLACGDRVMVK